ncbi:MAG TPA: glycosyltransferase family 4 protein [Anaerohalosphaeraceae bacterium]|nr:glycosyltransferase family 4 protein [Anaerohalosphaeraceae bacterium]
MRILLTASMPETLKVFYLPLIERLVSENIRVTVASAERPALLEFEEKHGCQILPLNYHRTIAPGSDMRIIMSLVKHLRANTYDIVHAHTPKAGYIGMLAAALAGVKCRVYTCHGLAYETETGFKRRLLKCVERLSCTLAHHVLVVSPSLQAKMLQDNLCRKNKMQILGDGTACGVDLKRFSLTSENPGRSEALRRSMGFSTGNKVIGFIGRLVPDKGIHILVESFLTLYNQDSSIRLLIIGAMEPHRGNLTPSMLQTIQQHPGITRLDFTDQIEAYYPLMDVFVLPTRREGFPYTVLEAAAMEVPSIATRVTGCVDAVIDHQTGILIPPESSSDLTKAIHTLLCDKSLAQSMGRQAKDRVVKHFSSQRLTDLHLTLYQEIAAQTITN